MQRVRQVGYDPFAETGILRAAGCEASSRADSAAAVGRLAAKMWANPRRGSPGDLPVIGLTGDLYTRVNHLNNHNLVERLQTAGSEVWLGPSRAATSDLATRLDALRAANQGRLGDLALEGLAWIVIVLAVARLVDFLERGAAGAISAAGVNCALGLLIAASIPAIRADHGGTPVISLSCGGNEGVTDKMKLETFVEQVKARRRRAVA